MAHNINHRKQGKSTTGTAVATCISTATATATAPSAVIAKTTVRFTEADRKLLRLIQADNLRRGDSYSASDVLREGLKVLAAKRKIWFFDAEAATIAKAELRLDLELKADAIVADAIAALAAGGQINDLGAGQEACLRVSALAPSEVRR
jgi:hypothetical protein